MISSQFLSLVRVDFQLFMRSSVEMKAKLKLTHPILITLVLMSGWGVGCHNTSKTTGSASVNVADPTTAKQLISGFHAVEEGRWRWTERKFSVVLGPPPRLDQIGARLNLRLYVSNSQLNRIGSITLSAEVNNIQLAPQTFDKEGEYLYTRDIPPMKAATKIVPVRFSLDKAAPPDTTDGRELGIIVTSIALEPR